MPIEFREKEPIGSEVSKEDMNINTTQEL